MMQQTGRWRYPLGLALVFLAWQIGQWPWLLVVQACTHVDVTQGQHRLFEATKQLDPNLNLALMLSAFAVGLGMLLGVQKYVHRLPVIGLLGPVKSFDINRFAFAFGCWLAVIGCLSWAEWIWSPQAYQWQFRPVPFVVLTLIALLLIPVQTAFEEMLFRAYLYQGLSQVFHRPVWVVLITGLLFGALHAMNPEVSQLGMGIMGYYIGTGVFLGLIRAFDQRLELCWGFHTANNVFMALWSTSSWSVFQTPALWRQLDMPDVGIEIFISLGVLFPLILRIFSLRYGWPSWRQALWAPTALNH